MYDSIGSGHNLQVGDCLNWAGGKVLMHSFRGGIIWLQGKLVLPIIFTDIYWFTLQQILIMTRTTLSIKKHWMNEDIPWSRCCKVKSLFNDWIFSQWMRTLLTQWLKFHSLTKNFTFQHHQQWISSFIQWFLLRVQIVMMLKHLRVPAIHKAQTTLIFYIFFDISINTPPSKNLRVIMLYNICLGLSRDWALCNWGLIWV